ncbi:MAG: DUF3703 domain-containing protein [Steroidobacteraceae bacterium]
MKLHRALAEAIDMEFDEAHRKLMAGDVLHSFAHLERAHVLGQKHTKVHVRAHWAMLQYARRYGSVRDVSGQIGRLLGAALFTWAWVPEGNTGGTNIGAFERLPIPPDLRRLISPSSSQE